MKTSLTARSAFALLCAGGISLTAVSASASGFSAARFGGIYGHPLGATPASVYYNPGAVSFAEGTQVYIDYTAAIRSASYERSTSVVDEGLANPGGTDVDAAYAANSGEATLFNLISAPMLGISTDFGGKSPVHVFAGFYAPFGGQAVWDKQDAPENAPWADDGPQRWHTIDGSIRTLVGTLGVSRRTDDGRFGFGVSGNVMISSVDTVRARNPNGSENVVSTDGASQEGRAWVEASSIDFGIGAGVMWQAIPDELTLAASWQSAPNITGNVELDGDLYIVLPGNTDQSRSDIVFSQTLPQTFRFGASYLFADPAADGEGLIRRGEVRLTGDVTTWNAFQTQCVLTAELLEESGSTGRDACRLQREDSADPDGPRAGQPSDASRAPNAITQSFIRDWNVGWGIKLGGSYWIDNKWELGASISYDANAVPDESLDPVLMDMPKIVLDVGASLPVTEWLDINLLVGNVFYFERVNENSELAQLQPNSRQPSGNGTYNQNILLLNAGLNFNF